MRRLLKTLIWVSVSVVSAASVANNNNSGDHRDLIPYHEGKVAIKEIKESLGAPLEAMMSAEYNGDLEEVRKIFREDVYAKAHYLSGVADYDTLNRLLINLKILDDKLESTPEGKRMDVYKKQTFTFKSIGYQCSSCHQKR